MCRPLRVEREGKQDTWLAEVRRLVHRVWDKHPNPSGMPVLEFWYCFGSLVGLAVWRFQSAQSVRSIKEIGYRI